MKERPAPRRLSFVVPAAVAALAVVILLISLLPERGGKSAVPSISCAEGLAFLQQLESRAPSEIDAELKAIRQAELEEMKQQWLGQMLRGEISVWEQFQDYALLGDSRAYGFSFYGFLPKERVLAGSGDTILAVEDHLEELEDLNPAMIFLCYGINDVGIGYWPEPSDYVDKISETLALLKKTLPGAKVYLSSILTAYDPAFARGPAWRRIPDYNDAVRAYCAENGVPYIDMTALCEENQSLYQDDGVHLQKEFYPLWAVQMISEVYSDGNEEQIEFAAGG